MIVFPFPPAAGAPRPLSERGLMGGGGPHRMGGKKGNGTLFLDEIRDPHRVGQGKGGLLPPLPAHAFLFQMRPLEDGIFLNVGAGDHAEHFIVISFLVCHK